MSGLIHTDLGSSSLIVHVLHSPPPPPANSFVIGPAVINTHTSLYQVENDWFEVLAEEESSQVPDLSIDPGPLCL
jgi:hypothetical protein